MHARDGRVTVVLDDYSITPQRIASRPGRLTFTVDNDGRVAHNLVVHAPGGGEVKPRLPLAPARRPGEVHGAPAPRPLRPHLLDRQPPELGLSGILTVG